jgi:hypothetical protein
MKLEYLGCDFCGKVNLDFTPEDRQTKFSSDTNNLGYNLCDSCAEEGFYVVPADVVLGKPEYHLNYQDPPEDRGEPDWAICSWVDYVVEAGSGQQKLHAWLWTKKFNSLWYVNPPDATVHSS